jgi:hypothetical protein
MSIFVDPNQTFPITLNFEYLRNTEGVVTGIRLLPEQSEGPEVQTLICQAAGRDYDTMSRVLEESTIINHITGQPVVRHSLFCRLIVLRFVRSWNVKDEHGNPVPIKSETLGKLRYELVRAITREWLKLTSGRGG